ncbi:MAG TPA: PLP-dependent aminotransferase family protein [Trebonia sp.]|jgi:GntR family transcriptional regulator/MocR family aminotransferase|nr:PLP-dependent aminotransferase family protein [Trebonia sp.]
MENLWANLDLHLDLDLDGPRVGRSLEDALRAAVRDGRLPPGTRLPATRVLAADLGIARNTVGGVYAQLTAEGWLTARTGAGTWVSGVPGHGVPPPAAWPAKSANQPANQLSNSAPGHAESLVSGGPGYDLHPGVPDLSAFPRRDWLAATRKALSAAPDHALDYPDPRGLPPLRGALAGYLARVRGALVSPERTLVTAGFKHSLAILSTALRARGAVTIAVEAYGLPVHRDVMTGTGLRLAPLPLDGEGAVPDDNGAGAVLLTPAHQFPLGMTLAPGRRRQFAEWAAATGGMIVEDDYDGEFRYDRHPVGAMQALAPEHVVYGGTASKALAPGLRIGWLAVPARLLDEVLDAARVLGGGPDTITQLALAEFLTSGAYDRQVRLARLGYRRRRDELAAALSARVPGARVTGISAGLHAVVELPPGQTEDEAIASAARHGVAVYALSWCAAGGAARRPPSLVVGYGGPPGHAFTTAVARLCAALSA